MISAKRELTTARRKLKEASLSLTGVYISMLGVDDRAAFMAKALATQTDITRDLALILRDKVRQAKVFARGAKQKPCSVCGGDKKIMMATDDPTYPMRAVPCPKCATPRVRAKFI